MLRLFSSLMALLIVGAGWLPTNAAAEPIRIGVLKFGTVNWALSVLVDKGIAAEHGVDLAVVPLANKNATVVALQGGAVDMIVSDWIWVSRQRAEGANYTFAPYSLAVGSVMVQADGGIETIEDLAGKSLGIAGGPYDKSWLLLRAYSHQQLGYDITEKTAPNFGAPPLLNQLASSGELDAVLNFWHFAARLKASGMRELIGVAQMLPALGVETDIPLLGWVFDSEWAEQNRASVEGFLTAARQAGELMKSDDALWTGYLAPKTKADSSATLTALRDGFRAGVPAQFGDEQIKASEQVFSILAEYGGEKLVGKSNALAAGTFWAGYSF